ncbi:MAG: hypothetical protein RI983_1077 [Bacteroidota bacterium]
MRSQSSLVKTFFDIQYLQLTFATRGGLAQLARALAWHARGRRFDPDTLHSKPRMGLFY